MWQTFRRMKWYLLAEYRAILLVVGVVAAAVGPAWRGEWLKLAVPLLPALLAMRRVAEGPHNSYRTNLAGKTALITGCNTGIGYHTAVDMAKQGCRILFCCRSGGRATEAMAKLKLEVPSASLTFLQVDLGSFASVNKFVDAVEKLIQSGDVQSLDFIINNGGLFLPTQDRTADGYDMHIHTNHLGPMLLTERLLSHVIKAKGRVINLASIAHTWAFGVRFSEDLPYFRRLERIHKHGPKDPQYGFSKACNIFHARNLARRVAGTGVKVCSIHPGGVMTEVFRNVPAIALLAIKALSSFILKTPVGGAQTTLHCVYAKEIVPGGFYCDCECRNDCCRIDFADKDVDAIIDWSFDAIGLPRPEMPKKK